jgi:predicted extracellular nuclease
MRISLLSWLALVGLILGLSSCFSSRNKQSAYTVAFYNVENLFDTVDDPNKIDEDFLPSSEKEWNSTKYSKKIDDLARVIYSIDSVKLPVLVGLCEIENNLVVSDLAQNKRLKSADYQVVWSEGPDVRSIDCALMFDSTRFRLVDSEFLKVENPDDVNFKTREIVYVRGMMKDEIFHVFVNHWPSRREGAEVSASKRALAAHVLRNRVDRILEDEAEPNIIIMGDMNDAPGDSSISQVLGAQPNTGDPEATQLVNLMYDEYERGEGSYSYRGKWDMIDNLIVSGNLLGKANGLKTSIDDGRVFRMPFMEFVNNNGEVSPNRTYGRTYFGGISDHFPVYFQLK